MGEMLINVKRMEEKKETNSYTQQYSNLWTEEKTKSCINVLAVLMFG